MEHIGPLKIFYADTDVSLSSLGHKFEVGTYKIGNRIDRSDLLFVLVLNALKNMKNMAIGPGN